MNAKKSDQVKHESCSHQMNPPRETYSASEGTADRHPEQEVLPIAEHGVIAAALVGTNGSIDFLCLPHFGSPTVFASILDPNIGGFFKISTSQCVPNCKQFYWPDTNILVTRFLCQDGVAHVLDLMPVRETLEHWRNCVVRILECVRGEMQLLIQCYPAFDYARKKHTTEITQLTRASYSVVFRSDILTLQLILRTESEDTPVKVERVASGVEISLKVTECAHAALELRCISPGENVELKDSLLRTTSYKYYRHIFHNNVKYWKNWLSQCTYRGAFQDKVHRSALILKLLTYEKTGAIVAALTFGLPEEIGGVRNWDYRYMWFRDAAFSLYALLRIGFKEEANAFMGFLEARCREAKFEPGRSPLQIMYGIHGEHELNETSLDHLSGYKNSKPVWIGNWAWQHLQLDIYGALMDAVYLYNKWGQPLSYDLWTHLTKLVDWVCDHWRLDDLSIWEPPLDRVGVSGLQFVYSKLMCWVAVDRAIRLADRRSFPVRNRDKWVKTRDEIYLEIMEKGWNPQKNAFTIHYGGESLDASHLMMPLVFFLAPNDPRMVMTIERICQPIKEGGLMSGGLVYRYQRKEFDDGLPGEEGTFNMCSFWLIESLARAGGEKLEKARLLFEQLLTFSNHLGLYSEETSKSGVLLGNFPQALTHLALISAAFNLNRFMRSSQANPSHS